MNNLKSYTEYAVTSETTDFVIGFDFNYGTDAVNVTVDGVPTTDAGYTVVYLNNTTMRLTPAVPAGVVRLQRETDIDVPDNRFTAGAKFIASNMDENFTQVRHAQQEVRDGFNKLSTDTYEIIDTLQDVGQAAQDAADAAEAAAELANDAAAQVSDKVPKSVTIPVYTTPTSGVDPVTGVEDGAYFNVRSSSDESYGVEYQNIGGVPTPSGKSYPSSAAVGVIAEKTGEVDAKLKRENVSVWDFFTGAELDAYKASPTTFDAHTQVQAFFDYVRDNDVGTAYCSGEFYTSQGFVFGDGTAIGIKTKNIDGVIVLRALNAIDLILDLRIGERKNWNGGAVAYGTGGTTYASRTCRAGIYVGSRTERCNITRLEVNNFWEIGVYCYNRSTLDNIGSIVCRDCGSGKKTANYSLLANYTAINTGSASSVNQRSTLTVNTLPPENIITQPYVVINDQPHYIYSIDRINSTLEVYPWVDSTALSGQLIYLFGGGAHLTGGDTSELNIGVVDATRCSIGYNVSNLYGANVGEVTVQACGYGVSFGLHPSGSVVGGVINNLYGELNDADLLIASTVISKFVITSTKGVDKKNKVRFIAPRTSDGSLSTTFARLQGITIDGDTFDKLSRNAIDSSSSINFNVFKKGASLTTRKGTATINLDEDVDGLNALYGYDSGIVNIVGQNASGTPSGTITFNPPAGHTVNGTTTAVFSGFSGIARFIVYYRVATQDFIVINVGGIAPVSNAVAYDPPSLSAGDTTTTTVTLTGAVVGNTVLASFSRYDPNIEVSAQVSAANTVTVKFKNTGAAPVDLASGTLTVKLI